MDVEGYGLTRNPFERDLDLDEACLPNPLAAQLSALQAGLRSPQGISVLMGERDSGSSMLAEIFARRLQAHARTALAKAPGPTLADVLVDLLAQLGGSEQSDAGDEDALLGEFAILLQCRARAGLATAIVIDEAHRLSPEVLAGLSRLFAEEADEAVRLYLFLIGTPEVLDRMNAGADRLLFEHLLQICRVEPLGLRDSIRYLERRLAACSGELVQLFEPEAIDEVVERANGRLLALETLAAAGFENAARRGATRVTRADVEGPVAASRAEEDPMAPRQYPQSLTFDFLAADREPGPSTWEDEPEPEDWRAGDETDEEESELTWESGLEAAEAACAVDDRTEEETEPAVPQPLPRRGLAAMAALTAAVFVALTWAANRLPAESTEPPVGRDALLFAKPLTSEPREILRLAASVEQADASAHVRAWNDAMTAAVKLARQEETSVEQRSAKPQAMTAVADSPTLGKQDVVASADTKPAGGPVAPASTGAKPRAEEKTKSAAVAAKPAPARVAAARTPAVAAAPKAPARAQRTAAAKTTSYTVQVGAFRTRQNAQDLIARYGARLRGARILNEGGLYRVVSGSFQSKGAAVAHEDSLQRAGLTTYVRTAVF